MTLCGSTLTVYLNGTNQQSMTPTSISPVNRTQNYFGNTNWVKIDPYSNAEYDEIKFYNRCLTQAEIINQMNLKTLFYNL